MSQLTYVQAAILGAVQGLTEFLPISSSAHLAFAQRWLGLPPSSKAMFVFDGLSHVATLASIVVVFASPMQRFLSALLRDLHPGSSARRNALRLAWLTIVATIPTGAIGLLFKEQLEAAFGRPRWIGVELIITGVMLAALAWAPRGRGGLREIRWWQAALIGVSQAIAILPGISRSGATIATAEFFGIRRRWAAEFSFLIAFPAILGAAVLTFKDVYSADGVPPASFAWGPLFLGTMVAFLLGIVSLRMLLRAVRRAKLQYFSVYCFLVGGLVVLGVL